MTKAELYQKACMLPLLPGVYIIRDKSDTIIYIGKAKRLRIRVSQYFREGVPHDNKVSQMIAHAYAFDVIVCQSEFEALVLAVIMLLATLMVKNGGQPVRKKQTSITENPSTAVDIDGSASATKKHRFSIRSILEPRVVPLSLTFMMFAIAYFANQSFIVSYVQSRHLPVSSDLFFMFYAVALLVLRLGLRDLFDSKGFRFWLTVCSLGMLAMLACMTFLFNDWMLLLAAIFTAVGYGLMSSVTQAQAVVIAGRERSGIANSTYYAGIDLGMSVGPFVGGLVYGHLPAVWFYPVFMLAMPVAWLIYLLCVKRVSR